MITSCPKCRQRLRVPDNKAHATLRCPACGLQFVDYLPGPAGSRNSTPFESTSRSPKKGNGVFVAVGIGVVVLGILWAVQNEERKAREARQAEAAAQTVGTALSIMFGQGRQESSSPSPVYREVFGDPSKPNLNQRLPGERADSPFDSMGRMRPGYRVNYDQNGNAVGYSKESR